MSLSTLMLAAVRSFRIAFNKISITSTVNDFNASSKNFFRYKISNKHLASVQIIVTDEFVSTSLPVWASIPDGIRGVKFE